MYENVPKISFGDLKTQIKGSIWPNGVPENLEQPINEAFEDALVDLQTYVDCLQAWHTDVFPQCSTFFQCGLTVLDKPRGRIHRIRTFQGDFCDPVTLTPASMSFLKCWSRRFMEMVTAPVNTGMPQLPMGFKFADPSTDSEHGRALVGLYAFERERIYISPWIQSLESIVIEWDGIKQKFADSDLWPDDRELKRALKLYVQKEFSRDFERDFTSKKEFKGDYEEIRADMMLRCREEKELPPPEPCQAEREHLWAHRTEDDNPDTKEKSTSIALIGDYGTNDSVERTVAALVKSWSPVAVVTLGDNNYQGSGSNTYDEAVGSSYRKFIYPYTGSELLWPGESDATKNQFWPALGNHDIDNLTDYLAYFGAQLPGNKRFYDVVIGPVHFFVDNSGYNTAGDNTEPAGNDALSVQAAWFRSRVAQSVSRWKVAVIHQPPYSSYRYPGSTALRWVKGVDLVVSGHNHHYERIEVDGQTYLINGAGGAPLYSFTDQVVEGSVFRYDEEHGAIRLTATCNGLRAEFINVLGQVIDSITFGTLESDSGSGSGEIPEPPPLPPATFEMIHRGPEDPRFDPRIIPGDPTYWPNGDPSVWGIWIQTSAINPTMSYNTWYWDPVQQDYI